MVLLLALSLVAGGEFVEQLGVHLHEGLEHVVDQCHNGLVPVLFADAVQRREHDRHDHLVVLLHQRHHILIVPDVQRSLCNLEQRGYYYYNNT